MVDQNDIKRVVVAQADGLRVIGQISKSSSPVLTQGIPESVAIYEVGALMVQRGLAKGPFGPHEVKIVSIIPMDFCKKAIRRMWIRPTMWLPITDYHEDEEFLHKEDVDLYLETYCKFLNEGHAEVVTKEPIRDIPI